jgi:hypothetical protein
MFFTVAVEVYYNPVDIEITKRVSLLPAQVYNTTCTYLEKTKKA